MKFLKFLFYLTYVLLVVWFYKTELRPGATKVYGYFSQPDTTIVLGYYHGDTTINYAVPLPHETSMEPIAIAAPDADKTAYLNKLFVNGSTTYEKSTMDPELFAAKSKELQEYIFSKFSLRQLKCINRIYLVDWEDLNDDVEGLTTGYDDNTNSVIHLPMLNNSYKKSMLHEIWHCIHNANHRYFHDTYEYKWLKIDQYVSTYARTNLDEDLAETGSFFSSGNVSSNTKFGIIKKFYEYTK